MELTEPQWAARHLRQQRAVPFWRTAQSFVSQRHQARQQEHWVVADLLRDVLKENEVYLVDLDATRTYWESRETLPSPWTFGDEPLFSGWVGQMTYAQRMECRWTVAHQRIAEGIFHVRPHPSGMPVEA